MNKFLSLRGSHADGGSSEKGERLYAVARMASSKILPESSEASGMSGDDEEDYESNDSTSPSGMYYGKILMARHVFRQSIRGKSCQDCPWKLRMGGVL